ncbi:MAG: DUF5662 family protein [Thermomicrobiales bacterium]
MAENNGFVTSTIEHSNRVHELLREVQRELERRGKDHDASKLREPERSLFERAYEDLSIVEYGSSEYKTALVQARQALDHHYAYNRHHPEYFADGVNAMTLPDLMEMLADWKAASERRPDADILQGIDINAERFALSPQLATILMNTANAWWGDPDVTDDLAPNDSVPHHGSDHGLGERELFDAACDRLWGAYRGTLEGRTLEEVAEEIGLETTHVEHVVHAVSAFVESERTPGSVGCPSPNLYPKTS